MPLWKVCFLIPTKNEEASVRDVIRSLRGSLDPSRFAPASLIVVDDSVDGTRRLARAAGAEVVVGGGRGLGSAMYEGLKTAANLPCDFIVTVDGDGQAEVAEVARFLQPLIDEEADLVVASRFLEKGSIKYRYRFINNFGTQVLAGMLRRLTALPLTDSHGGIRAMRREVAQELEMLGSHTYVQETIIDAVEKGFRVKELASVWKPRPHGSSRVVSSIPRYVFYTLPILVLRSGQHVRLLYSGGLLLIFAALATFCHPCRRVST